MGKTITGQRCHGKSGFSATEVRIVPLGKIRLLNYCVFPLFPLRKLTPVLKITAASPQ